MALPCLLRLSHKKIVFIVHIAYSVKVVGYWLIFLLLFMDLDPVSANIEPSSSNNLGQ